MASSGSYSVIQLGQQGLPGAPGSASVYLQAGANITVTGLGTQVSPFIISATGATAAVWGTITGTLANQTDLATALGTKANIAGQIFTGAISATNLSGTNTGDQLSVTGNAGTATALQTARNINGVAFDGTANITITAAAGTLTGTALAANVVSSSLTSVGTLTGLTVSTPINGSVTGSAGSVTTIPTLSGDVTNTGNAVTVNNSAVLGKVLTGYVSGAGIIAATDTILAAIQKLNGNDQLLAPKASPTFTGTVTLPAGQVVNGVTLTSGGSTANSLRADGTYVAVTSGTVTSVSVASANGLAGTVATATTTPAITLTTTVTGMLKGNGTAISAAVSGTDYAPGTSGLATGVLKSTTTTGALSIATAGTDYSAGTSGLATGILKSTTSTGVLSIAVSGTDYQAPGNYITALTGDVTASGPGSAAATLATSGVTAGSYTNANITVDAKGRVTAAANGSAGSSTFSAITSGTNTAAAMLVGTGASLGTTGSGTIAATTAATLATARAINGVNFDGSAAITITAAAGTLTGSTLASGVTASSLTSVGTIVTGVWNGTAVGAVYGGTGVTSYTLGDTLYASAANTLAALAGNTTTTKKFLTQTGNGSVSAAPAWGVLASADIPNNAANTTGTAAAWTTARNLAGNAVDGTANVAFANKFIVQGTTDAGLSGAQFLGALGTGLVKNTTTTGVLSIAVSGTDYQAPGNYITALTGDVTAAGPGSVAATLATVNSNVGSFTYASITVNAKGLITAASSGTAPVIGAGTTTTNAIGKWGNTTGTSLVNSGVLIDASNNITGVGTLASGAHVITSSSAAALAVGLNGSTNPAFAVDASTASSATGVIIKSAAAAGGVTITATSSGADESLTIASKGNGNLTLNSSNAVSISGSNSVSISAGRLYVPGGSLSGNDWTFSSSYWGFTSNPQFAVNGSGGNSLTASTEVPFVLFNNAYTNQHATGNITLQRDVLIKGCTHSAVGASVITDMASFGITGAPIAGTNVTATNSSTIYSAGSAVGSGVTNSYGLNITANTGATNNYAARLSGETLLLGAVSKQLTAKTAAFTADNTTFTYICDATSAAFAATLPAASTCTNRIYIFKKKDSSANAVTVTRAGSDTIDGATTYALSSQYKYVAIQSNGTVWYVVGNN